MLRRLFARARHRVAGALAGSYRSAVRGPGIEFADVRPYEPGDDVRYLDSAVTARTGMPHVRTYRAERECAVRLVVDVSGSMDGKRAVADDLVALLAFAAVANRDRVGLSLFSDRIEHHQSPARGDRTAEQIVRRYADWSAKNRRTDYSAGLAPLARHRRSAAFVISDFLGLADSRPLRIAGLRHDLTALWIRDPAERTLPDHGRLRLADAESGTERIVNTSSPRVRAAYAATAGARDERIARLLREAGVRVVRIAPTDDAVRVLVRHFESRAHQP
ncbi:MAG: DUF58 domain-containing protein [Gemmataceae bacterium]|nr:DUF58 domain-containing protein [Gemmataceae bacterium]